MPRFPRSSLIASLLVVLAALALCAAGWALFWFLTDDAFIAFRYASNRRLGHGYVWNPPPFRPVEGYTSWLWIVLLDAAWTLTGTAPPRAANVLSLACSWGSLLVAAGLVWRIVRAAGRVRELPLALALVLAAVVTNRTFLAWTSSGLETALFNVLVLLWLAALLGLPARPLRRAPALAAAAAALALVRPDGLLYVAATLVAAAAARAALPDGPPPRIGRWLLGWTPLLAVPAHLLWRRATYGEWLPNTYWAKHVAPWPAAGLRYLASWLLEYAAWIPLAVIAAALVAALAGRRAWAADRWWRRPAAATAALGAVTVIAHVGYYTLRVGGDHFEYRVLSHLVPLLPLALLWALVRLRVGPGGLAAVFAVWLLASWPLPWVHWLRSRALTTRAETQVMIVPVADALPGPLRPYASWFDDLQAWLIERHVCMRHREHQVYCRHQLETLPSREEGARFRRERDNVIVVAYGVGVPGWVFPHAAVIDALGLNDWVVARTPLPSQDERYMAHDRVPPPGYLAAFRPDLIIDWRGRVRERPHGGLTDGEIRRIEARFADAVQSAGAPGFPAP